VSGTGGRPGKSIESFFSYEHYKADWIAEMIAMVRAWLEANRDNWKGRYDNTVNMQ
jgi:hypothetical protein